MKKIKVRVLFNTYVQIISGETGKPYTLWIHRPVPSWAPLDLPKKGDLFLQKIAGREGCSVWKAKTDARHMGDPDQWEVTAEFIRGRDMTDEQLAAVEAAADAYEATPKNRSGEPIATG